MCKISVIMSTYKEPIEYIHHSVQSVLAQTMKDFEYIIVLDCPENQEIAQVITEYQSKDDRIVLLRNEKNLGLTASLNRALQVAKGEYIARMDADDFAYPDRLEKELAYLRENQLDLVGALMHRMNEAGELIQGMETRHYPPQVIMKSLRIDDCIPHPTWLGKREIFESLNGYRMMDRSEDYDFLLRALKKGYRLGLCDAYLLNYRISTGGISQSGLLKQWLSARYLCENFDRLEQIEMSEIKDCVVEKATDSECEKYLQADHVLTQALKLRKTNPLAFVFLLFKCFTLSKYYRLKFFDALKLRIIRKSDKIIG